VTGVTHRLRDHSLAAFADVLGNGVRFAIGPFVVHVESRELDVARRLHAHYPNYPLVPRERFADVRLTVRRNRTPSRHWWSTRVVCLEDGLPFTTFPRDAALAHLEWTLNWAIATRAHHFLMLHAAVLANDRGALLLPANPGSGKSTLAAYLMHRGWRLLSDEFTLIEDGTLAVHPFPRLVPLKNESIDVIRECVPEAHLGPPIPGTHKGTVVHLRPDDAHIARMHETAAPRLMIFPKYTPGASLRVIPAERSDCFVEITQNAFNYVLKGEEGFRLAVALTNRVASYRLVYSDLASAAEAIDSLMVDATA